MHAAASYKDPHAWAEDAAPTSSAPPTSCRRPARPASAASSTCRRRSATASSPLEQPITLDHPLRPVDSSYAISKTAGEHFVFLGDVPAVSVPPGQRLRAAQPLGPAADVLPPPDQRQAVLRHGHAARLRLRRRPRRPAGAGGPRRRASRAPTTPPRAPTSRSRSCTTRRSRRSGCPAHEVEVRERGEDDAFSILLDPSRTIETFGWTTSTPLDGGRRARRSPGTASAASSRRSRTSSCPRSRA